MEPTHALYIIDNWDGQGDQYWTLAYKMCGVFHHSDTNNLVLEHEGDEILKSIELD